MRSTNLMVLVTLALATSVAIAGDERGATGSVQAATPEPQVVQQSHVEQAIEPQPVPLLVDRPNRENDCVTLLALYFAGDPSMQGVTLFSILASCG